jgi:RimJ/RimL family protein N-acetyltransferase
VDGPRVVTSSDAALIARLHEQTAIPAYAGFFPLDAPPPTRAELEATWSERLTDVTAAAFVAWVGDRPVGSVMVRRDPDFSSEGQVLGLHVLPSLWGRGIGTALHEVAIRRLHDDGFDAAGLWVIAANRRARRLYEHLGWTLRVGVELDFLGVTEVRYERRSAASTSELVSMTERTSGQVPSGPDQHP